MIRAMAKSTIPISMFLLLGWLVAVLLVTLWPFGFFRDNGATVEEGRGVLFRLPATVYTSLPVSIPLGSPRWAVAIEVIPKLSDCECPGVIAIWGFSRTDCNFMLRQVGENLEVVVGARAFHKSYPQMLLSGKLSQLVIVADPDSTRLFINGTRRSAVPAEGLQLADLASSPLVFGTDAHGNEHWEGEICSFGIFDGTLKPEELSQTISKAEPGSAILLYRFGLARDGHIVNQGNAENADLVMPESFVPYQRVFLQNPPGFLKGLQGNLDDIIQNIVLFLPGGYLLTLVLTRKGMSRLAAWWLAVFAAFLLTSGIEVLQAFVPGRDSSWLDVSSNTIGGMLGAFGVAAIDAVRGYLMKSLWPRRVDR